MNEPLWKQVLAWGAVVLFLVLPIGIFTVQLYHLTHPGWIVPLEGEKPELQYLMDFMRNITVLVFGLAGLRTWETIKNGNKNNNK